MLTDHQFDKSDKLSVEQVNAVRRALESVVSSDAFSGSKRCQDFLRLIVEHALAGELDCLRERMIGAEMFGRPVDYDTSNDAVVRVRPEAGPDGTARPEVIVRTAGDPQVADGAFVLVRARGPVIAWAR